MHAAVQYELSLVLYPVFIHCCLQLVKNEAAGEATQLIGRHSARFTNAGGQRSKVRLQVCKPSLQLMKDSGPLILFATIQSLVPRIPDMWQCEQLPQIDGQEDPRLFQDCLYIAGDQ